MNVNLGAVAHNYDDRMDQKEYQKQYKKLNKEKLKLYSAEYYQQNKASLDEKAKLRRSTSLFKYGTNSEEKENEVRIKKLEYQKQYKKRNRETIRQRQKEYRQRRSSE